MAAEATLYSSFRKNNLNGVIDLENDVIKLMLVTSDYVFDVTHEVLADVNAYPDPEVVAVASPSNGYTKGGQALTGKVVTKADSPSSGNFDADDVTYLLLTATFRGGILYAEKTVGDIVNPLIEYILFDNAPADITAAGIDWVCIWSANGIITN